MNKISKSKNICTECNIKKGIFSNIFNIIICGDCKNKNKYYLITKTNAKKEYLLNDNDLIDIPFINKNSSYGPATYYSKENLLNYLSIKHDIKINDVHNYIENKKREKELLKQEKQNRINEKKEIKKLKRRDNLINALSNYKLNIRNDSQLCKNYIDGSNEYTIKEIVQRMCQMKYLYDYCHMNDCKDIAYESYTEELKAGYYPDMNVSEHAELIALSKYSNNKYPDIFPWMKDNE